MSSLWWPWLVALAGEEAGVGNLALLLLPSLSRPPQAGGRKKFVLEIDESRLQCVTAGKVL